ncbi:MAG: endo alpha-1,4 polygalactosaminidase [Solirubrobacterales bacterium]|nr:endo alpha-1,4 polygalactosaminidase [Solirubrobacterales bacterium]
MRWRTQTRVPAPDFLAAAALALAVLALAPAAASAVGGVPGSRHWQPPPRTAAWQWQLQGKIDPTVKAWAYDVDGFEATVGDVRGLHRLRRRAICYIDVGSWENFRPDKGEFPPSVLGNSYAGFPNERWLDVSRFQLFEKPLRQRIAMCAHKRFDAVEPDNIAGWEPENKTGFDITRADQLRFNRWIAREVHARGMAVALKNDGRQAKQLLPDFDFAIVEECFQYDECGYYEPFIEADKAVFEAEYELQPAEFCDAAIALGFSAIRKSYDLFAQPWEPCEQLAPSPRASLG